MENVANNIPKSNIISVGWDQGVIISFLRGIPKGTIFGCSSAIDPLWVQNIARINGVEVKELPQTNPLHIKYGRYVLRVTKAFSPKVTKTAEVSFEGIYKIELKPSKGKKTCKSPYNCKNTINKDSSCIELVELVELPSARKVYKRTAFCMSCATRFLEGKIKALSSLIE